MSGGMSRWARGVGQLRAWLQGDASAHVGEGGGTRGSVPGPQAVTAQLTHAADFDAAAVVDVAVSVGSERHQWCSLASEGFVRVPCALNPGAAPSSAWRTEGAMVHVWYRKAGTEAPPANGRKSTSMPWRTAWCAVSGLPAPRVPPTDVT